MEILSELHLEKLIENGKKIKDDVKKDIPVVVFLRLYNNPPCAWMLASIDPDNHDIAFGLMQIGDGFPELGYVSLKELEDLRGHNGNKVKHDPLFEDADKLDINSYAKMAKQMGQITLRFTEKPSLEDIEGLLD